MKRNDKQSSNARNGRVSRTPIFEKTTARRIKDVEPPRKHARGASASGVRSREKMENKELFVKRVNDALMKYGDGGCDRLMDMPMRYEREGYKET